MISEMHARLVLIGHFSRMGRETLLVFSPIKARAPNVKKSLAHPKLSGESNIEVKKYNQFEGTLTIRFPELPC
jgi:hypothetical protein